MKKEFGKEIGEWSEIKLKCIHNYLGAYSNILGRAGYKEYCFIDGFASTGFCKSKETSTKIRGSASLSLSVKPPFSKYFFIELDSNKINELEKLRSSFCNLNIEILPGDCNIEIAKVLQKIADNNPLLALLDPQAGDLYWNTIQKISKKNKAELLINFPFGMAINRYMPLENGKDIDSEMKERLNKIFGTGEWEPIYRERKKRTITPSQAREKYLDIYLIGLKQLGFKYYAVKNLKNSINVHIYYLIFATHHRKGLEKMKDNFVEGEPERETLFFKQDIINAIYNEFAGSQKISLDIILEKMLTGKNIYRVQDFKDALIQLEKDKKLIRINPRPRCRSFNETDLFKII